MKHLALAVLLAGCAHHAPTVRGADLYARVRDLRAHGSVRIGALEVHRGDFLLTDDQVFAVDDVVANCTGAFDADCTLALLHDQRFTVADHPPAPGHTADDSHDFPWSPRTRALVATGASTAALTAGALRCDAFQHCGDLLATAAILDGLAFLLVAAWRE